MLSAARGALLISQHLLALRGHHRHPGRGLQWGNALAGMGSIVHPMMAWPGPIAGSTMLPHTSPMGAVHWDSGVSSFHASSIHPPCVPQPQMQSGCWKAAPPMRYTNE